MKLTKKLCQEVNIINAYDYASGQPYIAYNSADTFGFGNPSRWTVCKKGVNLGDSWYDYGCKVFSLSGRENKLKVFDTVLAYMKQKFGIERVAKTPFGTWMEFEFVEERNEEIKKLLDKKKEV